MITYPEYTKVAAQNIGMKMVSIDIGGGMTFQGPASPVHQAKLASIFGDIADDYEKKHNDAFLKAIEDAEKASTERAEKAKAKAAQSKSAPNAGKAGK